MASKFIQLSVTRLPQELTRIYSDKGHTVTRVETDGRKFKVTTSSGRTTFWTRVQKAARGWEARLS